MDKFRLFSRQSSFTMTYYFSFHMTRQQNRVSYAFLNDFFLIWTVTRSLYEFQILFMLNIYLWPDTDFSFFQVFFGGWENTKSVIRKNKEKPDVVEVATPQILNAYQYKGFWIRWDNGWITAGVQGDENPLMRHHDPYLFHIQYFGVCTGWGASGHWIIDSTYHNMHILLCSCWFQFNTPREKYFF